MDLFAHPRSRAGGAPGAAVGTPLRVGSAWRAGAVAAMVAVVANLGVRQLALAAGLGAGFQPFNPASVVLLTVAGALGATAVLRWMAKRGATFEAFARLAVLALLASFLPDLGLLSGGAPLPEVATLMAMHVVAFGAILVVFRRLAAGPA